MANTRTPTPQRAARGNKPSSRVGETQALVLVTEEARPSGLITLAGTEMWERFSFYGLQALLAYYLYYSLADGGLGLPQAIALGIAGSYGGLVYIAQIIGAWIADRVLAPRLVVLIGGTAIMLGHLLLAFVPDVVGLVGGLALIVIGTGGLKVNTSMMVGQLYPEGGAKRDAGYSIYYMGITVGAFLGPLLTGILHQQWGFHVAFGAAAAGMAVGLVQYAVGMRKLPASTAVVPNPLSAQARVVWTVIAVIVSLIAALLILTGVVSIDNISSVVAIVVAAAAVLIFSALLTNPKVTFSERQTIVRYIPIFLMGLVFWTLLFQLFTAFTVYADTKVNLSVFGFTAPPSLIVTIESLFVAFITAALALLWSRSRNFRMSSVSKLVWGVVFMSLGAAAIVPFSVAPGESMPLAIIFAIMVLFALGEALFAPAALSVTAGMAPRAANAQMTALYFLTMAGGSTLAGWVAQGYQQGAEVQYFGTVAVAGLIAIAVLAVALKLITKRQSAAR